MNIITAWITAWRNKRALARLKKAAAIVEAAGYTVCKIVRVAGSDYILDGSGTKHRIGRK